MTWRRYVLDDSGIAFEEPDLLAWGRAMVRPRHVAQATFRDGVWVSTVFLGVDPAWRGSEPILFETMIFGGEHDQYQERYSTRTEALLGHKRACDMAAAAPPAKVAQEQEETGK